MDVSWNEWRAAAQLGRQLMTNGHALPLSDLVLAAVAIERNLSSYTSDPHFDLMSNLKRYIP